MGQLRLNGLALLHMHNDISVTADEVVTEFSNSNNKLIYIPLEPPSQNNFSNSLSVINEIARKYNYLY